MVYGEGKTGYKNPQTGYINSHPSTRGCSRLFQGLLDGLDVGPVSPEGLVTRCPPCHRPQDGLLRCLRQGSGGENDFAVFLTHVGAQNYVQIGIYRPDTVCKRRQILRTNPSWRTDRESHSPPNRYGNTGSVTLDIHFDNLTAIRSGFQAICL